MDNTIENIIKQNNNTIKGTKTSQLDKKYYQQLEALYRIDNRRIRSVSGIQKQKIDRWKQIRQINITIHQLGRWNNIGVQSIPNPHPNKQQTTKKQTTKIHTK